MTQAGVKVCGPDGVGFIGGREDTRQTRSEEKKQEGPGGRAAKGRQADVRGQAAVPSAAGDSQLAHALTSLAHTHPPATSRHPTTEPDSDVPA